MNEPEEPDDLCATGRPHDYEHNGKCYWCGSLRSDQSGVSRACGGDS